MALFLAAPIAGCENVQDPTDPRLGANVVEESPRSFAPVEGGMGHGTLDSDIPFAFFVLTEGGLGDAGETRALAAPVSSSTFCSARS